MNYKVQVFIKHVKCDHVKFLLFDMRNVSELAEAHRMCEPLQL